jgi:hypothetical protein
MSTHLLHKELHMKKNSSLVFVSANMWNTLASLVNFIWLQLKLTKPHDRNWPSWAPSPGTAASKVHVPVHNPPSNAKNMWVRSVEDHCRQQCCVLFLREATLPSAFEENSQHLSSASSIWRPHLHNYSLIPSHLYLAQPKAILPLTQTYALSVQCSSCPQTKSV